MKKIKYIIIFLVISSSLKAQNDTFSMLGEFNVISVYSGVEVDIIKGEENKIILNSKNALDNTTFGYKIKNKVLKLRVGIDKNLSLGNISVTLFYKDELDEIKLFQASKAKLIDTLIQTNIKIKVQEGSMFEGNLNTDKSTLEVFSGGTANISGVTSVSEIKTSTGGICLAENFKATQSNVKASIGSIAYVNSSLIMDVISTTGSIIRVYGNPKKLITKTTLGGKIKSIE